MSAYTCPVEAQEDYCPGCTRLLGDCCCSLDDDELEELHQRLDEDLEPDNWLDAMIDADYLTANEP